jgi:hypothetical protein
MRLEGLGQLKKYNGFIGNRTRDIPACSVGPPPVEGSFLKVIHPQFWVRDLIMCAGTKVHCVGVEVLTAVHMNTSTFRDIRGVISLKSIEVSKEHLASVFRVEDQTEQ